MECKELCATIAAEAIHYYRDVSTNKSKFMKEVIEDMVDVMMDDETTVQEYNMARDTLIEALYPRPPLSLP